LGFEPVERNYRIATPDQGLAHTGNSSDEDGNNSPTGSVSLGITSLSADGIDIIDHDILKEHQHGNLGR
jgi:hypothetical protein